MFFCVRYKNANMATSHREMREKNEVRKLYGSVFTSSLFAANWNGLIQPALAEIMTLNSNGLMASQYSLSGGLSGCKKWPRNVVFLCPYGACTSECVCMYICVSTQSCICLYRIYVFVCVYVCLMCMRVRGCVCVRACVCLFVCVFSLYACAWVCVYARACVCLAVVEEVLKFST